MSTVIVGDGPTGLSAALFLAKNDHEVNVFGNDETRLHSAYLYNYLGIKEEHGSDFTETARNQCREFGAELHDELVESVTEDDDGFTTTTESGDEYAADYLVVASGPDREIANDLDLEFKDGAVDTDRNGRTSKENVYSGGWTARPDKIQAAISVGDGAAIALDILSKEKGEPYHDFDVPE